jgi:hypothetical protein
MKPPSISEFRLNPPIVRVQLRIQSPTPYLVIPNPAARFWRMGVRDLLLAFTPLLQGT